MVRAVSVAEAKAKLSELLGEVAHQGTRIVVQRRGKPVAALVPMEDLERVEEETRGDWLDDAWGLLADHPEVCDSIDQVYAERQMHMPREVHFPWDEDE